MDDELEAVFAQYHVQRSSGLKELDFLKTIDEKAEEYAEMQSKMIRLGSLGTSKHDFSKAAKEIQYVLPSVRPVLTEAEREHRLDEVLRARKEREDRILALELERDRKAEEEGKARKQRWAKVVNKLKVHPQSSNYYASTPFKPGFLFYDGLLHAPKMNFRELQINIPHTLYYTTEIVHLYTSTPQPDPLGYAVCDEKVSGISFLKLIESQRDVKSTHPFDSVAVVMRGRGAAEHEMSKHLIDWTTFRHKIASSDLSQFSMLQKFVKSPGGKAAAIRISYHPSTKTNKANTAYFLSSTVLTSSFNSPSELMQRCVINLDTVDSFEVFKMTGSAIKEAETHAKALVWYLGVGYGVRFERIDLDFLKDETGKLWLSGCQGFVLDPTSFLQDNIAWKTEEKAGKMEGKAGKTTKKGGNDGKKGSFVTCKLCRLQYGNHELSHLIAVRMLLVFKAHSSNRRDLPADMDHINVVTPDILSQSVRVCDLCFMLITSEFQLIAAEKALALAMHIPYKEEPIDPNPLHQIMLPFLPKMMQQYRGLVYLRYLANHEALLQYTDLKVVFELNGEKTNFDVKKELFLRENGEIPIDRLRLFYFFSDPDRAVVDYWRNTRAKLSIWDQTSPGKLIATGEFNLFSDFGRGVERGQAFFQKKMVSLFPGTYKTSLSLTTIVGVSCDHLTDPRHVKTMLTRTLDVYTPEESYCNGDPLPTPWMEIFTKVEEEISFGEEMKMKDAYSSTLSPTEMRRMADITSPFPRSTLPSDLTRTRTHPGPLRPVSAKPILSRPKPDPPASIELSTLDNRTQESIRDVFATVNNYLRERPQSAVVGTDTEQSGWQTTKSRGSRVVGLESGGKPTRVQSARNKRNRKLSAASSASSIAIHSPTSTQITFSEQFKEISRHLSQDLRAFGVQSSFHRNPTNPSLLPITKETEKSQKDLGEN